MNILLTGGAGYIGSHTAVTLTKAGHEVVIFDNFCNSKKNILIRLTKILGKSVTCVEGDVRDTELVSRTLSFYKIDAVMHFAGLKAVNESLEKPISYYENNIQGTISLLKSMNENNIKILVFSSSATVYGIPKYLPIDEEHPTAATNPYGRSKLYIEEILKDVARSDCEWRVVSLRYFNPVGAHKSGLIGEDPLGAPNNLMPYIAQVAAGIRPFLYVYGQNYPTVDGTGVRDYIHVMDLAEGHLAALLYAKKSKGFEIFNLGAERGVSVLELVKEYERVSGKKILCKVVNNREGDVPISYAISKKSKYLLSWECKRSLTDMCQSSWNWQSRMRSVYDN